MNGCVLDTDVVIAALDRADTHHRAAAKVLRATVEEGLPLLLSVVNYAEALVRPAETEKIMRVAVGAIDSLGIGLVTPTPAIAREAARLRGRNISLADGFALATARANGAGVATFDRRVRRAADAEGIELARPLR